MDFASTVQRQRAFFQTGATRPLDFRRTQLERLHAGVEQRETALGEALRADLGKSAYAAYSTEVGLVLSETRYALRCLPAWMKSQRRRTPWLAWPSRGFIRPEPYGVALVLGPWNYPVQLMLAPLVGALAAGNCAVLKPSEFAPRTAGAIAELVAELFPSEYVVVVPGGRETASFLPGARRWAGRSWLPRRGILRR
jgi:aldehyde dehydrogenase (NAD+)